MRRVYSALFLLFLALNFFGDFISHAQKLPDEEVEALRRIATKLNKTDWDVNVDPCSKTGVWRPIERGQYESNVTCNCTFNNNTTCHVTNILLKGHNFTGVLLEEFANLTFLEELDLTRNYLSGSIPASWASLPLKKLSLLGNRISGIPVEFGSSTTLEELVIEDNQFSGRLPSHLGNLRSLREFLASANNFTGTIPETYRNLANLEDFRIDGSSLSGRIPDLIGNWTRLTRLDMQGTSMQGPIPSSIGSLTNLSELRITDLKGSSQNFPPLERLTKLERLVLRNCLISGKIPDYIGGTITTIKSL